MHKDISSKIEQKNSLYSSEIEDTIAKCSKCGEKFDTNERFVYKSPNGKTVISISPVHTCLECLLLKFVSDNLYSLRINELNAKYSVYRIRSNISC